jgi:hypothetical protein
MAAPFLGFLASMLHLWADNYIMFIKLAVRSRKYFGVTAVYMHPC